MPGRGPRTRRCAMGSGGLAWMDIPEVQAGRLWNRVCLSLRPWELMFANQSTSITGSAMGLRAAGEGCWRGSGPLWTVLPPDRRW